MYVACESSDLFCLSTEKFLAMSVVMSPAIAGVHPSLRSTTTMASKRVGSKETIGSATGDAVEQVSMSFLVYEDTKLFIYRVIKMKWKYMNDTF